MSIPRDDLPSELGSDRLSLSKKGNLKGEAWREDGKLLL